MDRWTFTSWSLILMGIAVLLCAVWYAVMHHRAPAGAAAAEGLLVDSPSFDFGTRSVGDVIQHLFSIRNTSSRPQTIVRVVSSCSCTTSVEPPLVIAPHAAYDLQVTVTASGGESFGSQVTVFFDAHAPIRVTMHGRVIRQCPPFLDFGRVKIEDAPMRDLRVRSLDGKQVRIRDLRYDATLVEVVESHAPDAAPDELLSVRLKPGARAGPFRSTLQVLADDARAVMVDVVLQGYILRKMELDPNPVLFGVVKHGATRTTELRVYSPYGRRFRIVGSSTSPPDLIAAQFARPDALEAEARLRLTLRAPSQGRLIQGTVLLDATDEGGETTRLETAWYALLDETP